MNERMAAVSAVGQRPAWVALARWANAIYFLLTATYCILTYSSFAYQQFIRPRLVSSLTSFIIWHHLWHWLALGVTWVSLMAELRRGRARWMAWIYVGVMSAVGLLLLWKPVLPSVENDGLGLRLAALFLLPPLWLGIYDHIATRDDFDPERSSERRLVWSGLTAALIVWAFHVASVPWRLTRLGDLPLNGLSFAFGASASLLVHVAAFGLIVVTTAAALRMARTARAEYWIVATLSAGGAWLVIVFLVFASLSFRGAVAGALAAELALVLTVVWSGVARRLTVSRPLRLSVLDAWWTPFGLSSSRRASVAMVLLPLVTFFVVQRASTFDWNFMVQNLLVLAAWLLAVAAAHALMHPRHGRVRATPLALSAGVLLMAGVTRGPAAAAIDAGLTRPSFVPEFALDAYAAVEPSYRLVRHLLWVDPPGSSAFYHTLEANSLIQHVDVSPIDVDFVAAPMPPATAPPPDIFLFVIDSLRRDYVGAYNPAVSFTPEIVKFAAEPDTFTFKRHFTRYGGTGLSMPAIWAGGLLLHKEYVLPFERMNALGKLLKANAYHSILSLDHITAEILSTNAPVEELDRGRDEMDYDLCTTLGELQRTLERSASSPPIFAHTRSLNLHVSKMTRGSAVSGAEGFAGPAATAIGRMDACLGGFVDFLKISGRYDNSIIILTSDHGDSLGEAMRWGHSYTLFPEIVRTPLLMHVPDRVRRGLEASTEVASFSTDLTPSLYTLLGYATQSPGWAYGSSLFAPPGTDHTVRRQERVLVSSSYGPVYGLVEDNGRAMYVADAVNGRDYAYDLSGLRPLRVGVTAARRADSRALITSQLADLAAMYHFTSAR